MQRLISRLTGEPPTWTSLARFGRSWVFRSAYVWLFLVPLAARALEKLPSEITIPEVVQEKLHISLKTPITIQLTLPFSWQAFFWSAVFASAANVVYDLRCPRLIRVYHRVSDFKSEGKGDAQLGQEFEAIATQAGLSGYEYVAYIEEFISKFESRAEVREHARMCAGNAFRGRAEASKADECVFEISIVLRDFQADPATFSAAFWYACEKGDLVNPWERRTILGLYVLTSALVLWVASQNVYSVLRVTRFW